MQGHSSPFSGQIQWLLVYSYFLCDYPCILRVSSPFPRKLLFLSSPPPSSFRFLLYSLLFLCQCFGHFFPQSFFLLILHIPLDNGPWTCLHSGITWGSCRKFQNSCTVQPSLWEWDASVYFEILPGYSTVPTNLGNCCPSVVRLLLINSILADNQYARSVTFPGLIKPVTYILSYPILKFFNSVSLCETKIKNKSVPGTFKVSIAQALFTFKGLSNSTLLSFQKLPGSFLPLCLE